MSKKTIFHSVDWITIALYLCLVGIGWMSIYAVGYYESASEGRLGGMSPSAVKQLTWMGVTALSFGVCLLVDSRFYQSFSYIVYAVVMVLLIGLLFFGARVSGHNAWYKLGFLNMQPSELAKAACAFALATYLGNTHARLTRVITLIKVGSIILIPTVLILLQGDVGSGLVLGALVIVLYREGLPSKWIFSIMVLPCFFILVLLIPRLYLIIGTLVIALLLIGLGKKSFGRMGTIVGGVVIVFTLMAGIDVLMTNTLKPHQRNRIKTLLDPNLDPHGIGWNVTQAKIAIGSGGIFGKGFLKGTQTRYGFVPAQHTDFIFCTIGEEYGWIGSVIVIALFIGLLLRLLYIAERQKLRFARVYGYAVFSILLFHFVVNVGMTMGLMPVIGIPLPFISYGGSALCTFSTMIFVLLKLDAERMGYLAWKESMKSF